VANDRLDNYWMNMPWMGGGAYQQQEVQRQRQMTDLKSQLAALNLPLQNLTAFQPQSVQTLMQPGAAQPNWNRYGRGPEMQFFQPYYFNLGAQIGQSRDLQKQVDKLNERPQYGAGGLLNFI
jgi:hypothetical protein